MPLTGHLEELRSRLIKSCVALSVAIVVTFSFAREIIAWLTRPLEKTHAPNLTLIGTAVTEAFFTKLEVAFIAAIFLSLPVSLWQAWRFVAPGLYANEKRHARGFALYGTLFFFLGAGLCYALILTPSYGFLLERYEALQVRPALKIGEYLSFTARLLLASGICFEMPVAAYYATRAGLVDHRRLWRSFPYALLAILFLAALLTPPDLVSQALLSLPFLALYGASIFVAYLARRPSR
jgi:sec-independent protein translocase protein TatC